MELLEAAAQEIRRISNKSLLEELFPHMRDKNVNTEMGTEAKPRNAHQTLASMASRHMNQKPKLEWDPMHPGNRYKRGALDFISTFSSWCCGFLTKSDISTVVENEAQMNSYLQLVSSAVTNENAEIRECCCSVTYVEGKSRSKGKY